MSGRSRPVQLLTIVVGVIFYDYWRLVRGPVCAVLDNTRHLILVRMRACDGGKIYPHLFGMENIAKPPKLRDVRTVYGLP